jgi:anti-sigma regulatory factor (Ser/Thr protein kinase)
MLVVFEETIASTQSAIVDFLILFKNRYLQLLSDNRMLLDRIEYVLMETLENAHEHGNRRDDTKSIHICCWRDDERLTFAVEDEGDGFNGKIPATAPSISDRHGRGLFSIKEFTESLLLNAKGNKITFTFRTR